jgi:acetylornithine/succinyldiaminopimelate/putrescine aminotransferase
MNAKTPMAALHAMRDAAGPRRTHGLDDKIIGSFLAKDPTLAQAIEEGWQAFLALQRSDPASLALPEPELIALLQEQIVNFYEVDAINPYVPIAARGPWIVTSHGAVVHDSGGYGMLGFGHGPQHVIDQMAKPWVIANVMTASFSQKRLTDALRREIGHTRGDCPFHRFLCMNSGSESVTVAARISDIQALQQTRQGGRHEGRTIKFLALRGGFHGRTDRPAQASGSTNAKYRAHLASFQRLDNLVLVEPNDVKGLEAAFAQAEVDRVFFEMMLIEPVMGEGNPGVPISRAFYDRARALTEQMGTLLLVDSIQAGLRAHGCLSIVDYPGFQDASPPDLETYSKALNAAQFPLSVLALGAKAAGLYRQGVYGNTMTGNPRACEVGATTLGLVTPELRENIRARGAELLDRLRRLAEELPGIVLEVHGTGLLVAAELHPSLPVVGAGGVEERCRLSGLGVIHGGKNALRFTPHFRVSSEEIGLMMGVLREVLEVCAVDLRGAAAK